MNGPLPVGVVIGRIGEPIHVNVVALRVVDLPHSRVQLVVGNAAPVWWLFVVYRLACQLARVGVHVHTVGVKPPVVTWAVGWRRAVWAVVGTLK